MSLQEIEKAIIKLPPAELSLLADWFAEFQAQQWDRQIENDVLSGRLDALVKKANADFDSGHYKAL